MSANTPLVEAHKFYNFILWVVTVGIILFTSYATFDKLRNERHESALVTVKMRYLSEEQTVLLFYRDKGVFSGRNRVKFQVPQGDYTTIYLRIPSWDIYSFRIDPGIGEGRVEIRNICIIQNNKYVFLTPEHLIDTLRPNDEIRKLEIRNNALFVEFSGKDPKLVLKKNLHSYFYSSVDYTKVIIWLALWLLLVSISLVILRKRKGILIKINQMVCLIRNRKSITPAKCFLITALGWGGILIFFTPPFQSPDEFLHFDRAYMVSEGKFLMESMPRTVGGFIPESIKTIQAPFARLIFKPNEKTSVSEISSRLKTPLKPEKITYVPMPNSAQYVFLIYLPQASLIIPARLLELNPLVIFYAGRLGNLLFFVMMIYLAIRMMPTHQWLLCCIALLPMTMFQAASLSPDVSSISAAFLVFAFTMNYIYNIRQVIDWKSLILFLLLVIWLCFAKNAYFPLAFLLFLVPAARFETPLIRKTAMFLVPLTVMITLAIGATYLQYIYRNVDITKGLYAGMKHYPQNILPHQQLSFIISHPLNFIMVLYETLVIEKRYLLRSTIGILGWLDTKLPGWYYFSAYSVLIFLAITGQKDERELNLWKKGFIASSGLLSVIMIYILLYMSFSTYKQMFVSGVQGRYFIPVLPVIMILFGLRKRSISMGMQSLISISFILLTIIVTFSTLLFRYYSPL